VRITADTNLLVRALTGDDPRQAAIAETELATAEAVALTLPVLCELVWVLRRSHRLRSPDVAEAIRRLINSENVLVDRTAAEAGLALLDAGGDFADGVIAHEGRWLGADVFVSFDRDATAMLEAQGERVRLLK
jgi:predicted nucleic-acid-binding protein